MVNCRPLQLQEHELARAHKTVNRLLQLIAQDGQITSGKRAICHPHDADAEAGILGVAFGADNVVMEIMPNSPADDCGIIHIGDRLLQIDGREISEEFRGRLQGEVGTTVELSLETSLAEGHGHSGLDSGRVKCVKLTRASAMGIIMSNWSLTDGIESLAKYVEAHVAGTRGGAATSGKVGARCGKSEEVQREKKGAKAVMPGAAASQDKERRLMQEREVRMTLENRLLKQQLAEKQVHNYRFMSVLGIRLGSGPWPGLVDRLPVPLFGVQCAVGTEDERRDVACRSSGANLDVSLIHVVQSLVLGILLGASGMLVYLPCLVLGPESLSRSFSLGGMVSMFQRHTAIFDQFGDLSELDARLWLFEWWDASVRAGLRHILNV